MATIFEKIKEHFKENQKPREIGRYYASEIYDIVSGKLNAQNFFSQPERKDIEIERMTIGEAQHLFLGKILKDYEIEKEVEVEIEPSIKIIGKIDAIKEVPIEFKTTRHLNIKEPYLNHLYQLECYLRMTEAKFGWIVYIQRGTWRSKYFKIEKNANRWTQIISAVKNLHQQLCQKRG